MITANMQEAVSESYRGGAAPYSPLLNTEKQAVELALVRRVQSGDTSAFYELVRPYERPLFLAAFGLVKNDADAEDVAQEAVLKAFKGISHFRSDSKFSTWLIQIAINEAKMKL